MIWYRYIMKGETGQANFVWAEADALSELAEVVCSAGSIGTIARDPDTLCIFNGSAWLTIDKPNLGGGPFPDYDGIDVITLLAAMKVMQPYMLVLNTAVQRLDALTPHLVHQAEAVPTTQDALHEGMVLYDTTAGELKVLTTPGVQEVVTITVTKGAETNEGTITVSLDGVDKTAEVDEDATKEEVAALIRALEFDGWTASGSGAVAVFTADEVGACDPAAFTDTDSTGVTATVAPAPEGVNSVWKSATLT